MNTYLNTHLVIALNAFILAIFVCFMAWYTYSAKTVLIDQITGHMSIVEDRIIELAELTDRNGADDVTEKILTDCKRRSEFEDLLSRLSSASPRELITTQQLFESCGPFHAERKALMVSELAREYASLKTDLDYLSTQRDLTRDEQALTKWGELVDLERERSSFLFEQTDLQAGILKHLIDRSEQKVIQELAAQAQNVSQSLGVVDAKIDALRTELIP